MYWARRVDSGNGRLPAPRTAEGGTRKPSALEQVEHPLLDLIAQRVFGLALGYEDLNDHGQLRSDPMLAGDPPDPGP
jgi:hypothetical protein